MVRLGRAVVVGAVVSLLIAVLSFAGGVAVALRWGTTIPLVAAIGPAGTAQRATPPQVADQFKVFWEVWNAVDQQFYRTDALDYRQMTYGAIRGMLQSLNDEYTGFDEPEDAAKRQERLSGKFEGIGAYIEYKDGKLLIVAPIEESPAEKAGLKAGDQVLKVDDQEMSALLDGLDASAATTKAVSIIRGEAGTNVKLLIFRADTGETLEFEITRGAIPLISVRSKLLDGGIGYIQLTEFKETTASELDRALNELLAEQPRGIILDVRNNPGGYLSTAQEVLGRFLPDGVALQEKFGDGSTKILNVSRSGDAASAFDVPLVVLTNNGSASASEIVAGALRDRDRATLLGEKTFGKGSVQTIRGLSDGSSARITIAQWVTPNGTVIHRQGIEPDVYVPLVQEEQYRVELPQRRPTDPESVDDSQLWWAVQVLTSEERPAFPTPTPVATATP
jgi:carboxyl-terminal processing protease